MSTSRLDKFLSSQLNISRSDAKSGIRSGKAAVNGKTVKDSAFQVNTDSDKVTFADAAVEYKEFIYLVMNKPAGVLSASNDKRRKTVVDLVPNNLKRAGLFPVGRLDMDTTGLLLITDDGNFAHRVISPKSKLPKTYIAELDGDVTPQMTELFEKGVVLADGARCAPSQLKRVGDCRAEITITEGKYHQIKRMFGTEGLGVNGLKRISIGSLKLGDDLAYGDCRELSREEYGMVLGII